MVIGSDPQMPAPPPRWQRSNLAWPQERNPNAPRDRGPAHSALSTQHSALRVWAARHAGARLLVVALAALAGLLLAACGVTGFSSFHDLPGGQLLQGRL